MAVLKQLEKIQYNLVQNRCDYLKLVSYFFSAEIFCIRVKFGRKSNNYNSVMIINWLCHFVGKVSTAFELSFSEEFYFFARTIITVIKLYFIGSAFSCFTTCISSKSSILFWKFQICVQSLNSPKFENMLLGDDRL